MFSFTSLISNMSFLSCFGIPFLVILIPHGLLAPCVWTCMLAIHFSSPAIHVSSCSWSAEPVSQKTGLDVKWEPVLISGQTGVGGHLDVGTGDGFLGKCLTDGHISRIVWMVVLARMCGSVAHDGT